MFGKKIKQICLEYLKDFSRFQNATTTSFKFYQWNVVDDNLEVIFEHEYKDLGEHEPFIYEVN